jgi:hypothetical protein
MKNIFTFYFLCMFISFKTFAQEDDLSKVLENPDSLGNETEYVSAIFKGTHLINGHTVKMHAKGTLQFMISHRFGKVNQGFSEFFGLDQATIRLGLDYALTNYLTIGIGRSSFEKTYDGFAKVRLLQQKKGIKNFPFSAVWLSRMSINGLTYADPALEDNFKRRVAYSHQLLLARKFSEKFSFQFMPSWIHLNLVENRVDKNDIVALGAAGRYKFSKRMALTSEYYYVLPDMQKEGTFNSLSFGLDIETGGHVFQLHLTNSLGMIEKFFIPQTLGDWTKGDIHIGFNISRVF